MDYNVAYPEINLYGLVAPFVDFKDKKVLDFGGGRANLLRSAEGAIQQKDYTVLEVQQDLVMEGMEAYPDAEWLYQDLYNPTYNTYGVSDLEINDTYDIIFTNSVFTHTSYEQFDDYYHYLKTRLNPGGIQVHSFCRQDNDLCKEWFYNARVQKFGSCQPLVFQNDIEYLVDNEISSYVPFRCTYLLAWYKDKVLEQYGRLHKLNHTLDFVVMQ